MSLTHRREALLPPQTPTLASLPETSKAPGTVPRRQLLFSLPLSTAPPASDELILIKALITSGGPCGGGGGGGTCGSAVAGGRAVTQDMLLPPALSAQGSHIHLCPGKNSNSEDDGGNHEATRLPLCARLLVTPNSSPVAPAVCMSESPPSRQEKRLL